MVDGHHQSNQYLDISPDSFFSDADFLFTSGSSSSSSSTPALFPDLSAVFPPVDTHAPQLFYDPLIHHPSMFPGDPDSLSSSDQFHDLYTMPGYPTSNVTTADDIDWTALGCLPGPGNGPSEHPAHSLSSRSQGFSSVDSPGTLNKPFLKTRTGTNQYLQTPRSTTTATATKANPK